MLSIICRQGPMLAVSRRIPLNLSGRARRLQTALAVTSVLVIALSCKPTGPTYERSEVSGRVLFKGNPLKGGKITFVADIGGLTGEAVIGEDGTYSVQAPVGPVHITVDNSMLRKGGTRGGPILHRPDAPDPSKIPGEYVALPKKYASAQETNLTFTVVKGDPQTFEVRLE